MVCLVPKPEEMLSDPSSLGRSWHKVVVAIRVNTPLVLIFDLVSVPLVTVPSTWSHSI